MYYLAMRKERWELGKGEQRCQEIFSMKGNNVSSKLNAET